MTEAQKERRRQWKVENREKIRLYQIQYRKDHPGSRKYDPEEYKRRREVIAISQLKYREANKEKKNEYRRAWRAANPLAVRLDNHIRRTGAHGVKIIKEEICNWDSRICGICHILIEDKFELDHIKPLSRGGLHEVTNLQLSHPSCNRRKNNKLPEEMELMYA